MTKCQSRRRLWDVLEVNRSSQYEDGRTWCYQEKPEIRGGNNDLEVAVKARLLLVMLSF